jgi:TetR/AcrR family transcriptional repressor of mexJK operon
LPCNSGNYSERIAIILPLGLYRRRRAIIEELLVTKPKTVPAIEGDSTAAVEKRQSRRVYTRKNDIVLEAAERVFLRSGFAATSMDEIAIEAQVSKRTVYSNFESKQALFAEVIRKRCAVVPPDPTMLSDALLLPPEDGLVMLAIAFLRSIYDPAQVELYQTVIAAVRRTPEVGRIMYDGPITKTQRMFEEFLQAHVEAGRLDLGNVEEAAAQLIALLKTNTQMKVHLRRPARTGPKTIQSSAESSVRLFLHGALPRRS